MINEKQILILYTTAICNLNCKYCFIDKNPALVKIDQMLDESFDSTYYTEFAKKVFPKRNQLRRIEFWGGEPTLRLDRAYRTVHNLIQIYPRLTDFFFSTNFTNVNWNDQFFGLIDVLEQFEDRKFVVNVQLSLDGPEEITDAQRGNGVFKKFHIQMKKFMEGYNERKDLTNVRIHMFFKPTLTGEILEKYLSTKEDIIKYYKTFEEVVAYVESNRKNDMVQIHHTLPNFASPGMHTTYMGKVFAEFTKNCYEIMKQNEEEKIFDKYTEIRVYRENRSQSEEHGYASPSGCGTGQTVIGLLPENYVSNCHGAFVSLLEDYKQRAIDNNKKGRAIDTKLFTNENGFFIRKFKEDQELFEYCLNFSYDRYDKARLANMTNLIITLALNEQIDGQYMNPDKALKAAKFVTDKVGVCFRDNIASTNSCAHTSIGMYRLLLNGAKEWIEKE